MARPGVLQQSRGPAEYVTFISNPWLYFLPPDLRTRVKDFFTYSANFLPLAASGTATVDIAIQNDSDFLIVAATRVVSSEDNATEVTFPPLLVTIVDSSSGRQLMDRAVHIENLFGSAQRPSVWPSPKLIRAAGTLSTTCQNLTATARNVRISYLGFKVFGTAMGSSA